MTHVEQHLASLMADQKLLIKRVIIN